MYDCTITHCNMPEHQHPGLNRQASGHYVGSPQPNLKPQSVNYVDVNYNEGRAVVMTVVYQWLLCVHHFSEVLKHCTSRARKSLCLILLV